MPGTNARALGVAPESFVVVVRHCYPSGASVLEHRRDVRVAGTCARLKIDVVVDADILERPVIGAVWQVGTEHTEMRCAVLVSMDTPEVVRTFVNGALR